MTTSPFLTSSPILLRRWLGTGLQNLRRAADVGQDTAAARLDVRRQTIGHYESGRNLPSVGDLEALLTLYESAGQLEHFRALRDGARRGENWWQKVASIPPWFDHYLGLESGADTVDIFGPMYIPGLLQTQGYAKAVVSAEPSHDADRVRELVSLRTQRRHILDRAEHPARLRAVLDESALYRLQGDNTVMREQLDALLADLKHPQITLRILPLSAGAFRGQVDHPFLLLGFPDEMVGDHGVAYVEVLSDARYYEEIGEIEQFTEAMEDLLGAAANLKDSTKLIEQAKEAWQWQ